MTSRYISQTLIFVLFAFAKISHCEVILGGAVPGALDTQSSVTVPFTDATLPPWPDCNNTVSIPNGYTDVPSFAFNGCTKLTTLHLPISITSVGFAAFYNSFSLQCVNTTSTTLFNAVVRSCYGSCSNARQCSVAILPRWPACASTVNIPNGYTSVPGRAFSNCKSLTSLYVPTSVISIGASAFLGCVSLAVLHLPTSVTSVGIQAFYDDSALQCVNTTSTALFDSVVFSCYGTCSNARQCSVPILPPWPSCDAAVNIPDGYSSVPDRSFNSCKSLTSLYLPAGISSIGMNAFAYCNSLTALNLPNSVTSVGVNAFAGCTSLTILNLPTSVISIGNGAFFSCTSLISLTLPSSITSIGDGVFSLCTKLPILTLPNSLVTIGDYAFHYCSSLTIIHLPSSVTRIGSKAFYGELAVQCVNTTNITLFNSAIESCEGTCSNAHPCSVPSLPPWPTCNTTVDIPDGYTSIPAHAFDDCTKLTVLNLPSSITNIGDSAFQYDAALQCVHTNSTILFNAVIASCQGTCPNARQCSASPTARPSSSPTVYVTTTPTSTSTLSPSADSTAVSRTVPPTFGRTINNSKRPSSKPTRKPTRPLRHKPTSKPSKKNTSRPSKKNTSRPSKKNTSRPSKKNTSKPSKKNTAKPLKKNTSKPSKKNTSKPSKKNTSKPSKKAPQSRTGDTGIKDGQ